MDSITMDELITLATMYALPIFWAILILIIGRLFAKIMTNNLFKLLSKSSLDETLIKFIKNLTYAALMAFVVLAALEEIGVETTTFAAVVAAAGLAIGFALQSSLSNFASGFMLLLFKPFKVGDFVEAGGVSGIIVEIQLFTTKLKTGDNKIVIVPNGQITGGSITNYSAEQTRRLDLIVGVSYDDDIKNVRTVLLDILNSDDRILKEPELFIGVLELADNSVNFAVRPWVKTEHYWPVYFHLQETIKLRFDEEKISFPFPQRDIHIVGQNTISS